MSIEYFAMDNGQPCHFHNKAERAWQCADRLGQREIVATNNNLGYSQVLDRDGNVLRDSRSAAELAALRLARGAGYWSDEHGSWGRGDHWTVTALDYLPPGESVASPYLDSGGEGLALIRVTRKRVYARSARCGDSLADTLYLVGRNEAGTYFAHAVPSRLIPRPDYYQPSRQQGMGMADPAGRRIRLVLDWIWSGHVRDIITRQGDVALIRAAGNRAGFTPPLPARHDLTAEGIVHPTHPTLPLPQRGERVIVAKRASGRVSPGTRD